jgi:hypothetical protein
MLASFTAAAMMGPGQKKKPPARKVRSKLAQTMKRTQAELWGGKMRKADEWAKKLEFRESLFNIGNMAELSHENASVDGSAITGIRALEGLNPYERGLIPSASSVNQVNRDMAAGFSDTTINIPRNLNELYATYIATLAGGDDDDDAANVPVGTPLRSATQTAARII